MSNDGAHESDFAKTAEGETNAGGASAGQEPAPKTRTKKKRRVGRIVAIVAGSLVLVLAIAVGVLWLTKPWAPNVEVSEPGPSGNWVEEEDMVAQFYPAGTQSPAPGVLMVGGSEGGLNPGVVWAAEELQSEGYLVLAMSYFGAEGQNDALTEIPLEMFHDGLDWLAAHEQVDEQRLNMYGGSKGGEAALLVASQRDDLRAVIANVPTHVVWQGLDLQRPWQMGSNPMSSWSFGGEPLPYTATPFVSGDLREIYDAALDEGVNEDSYIDIASIEADVLVTCGELDSIWPSCTMSQDIVQIAGSDGPDVTVLEYPDGGHMVQGPPSEHIPDEVMELGGGTAQANRDAQEDAWPKVLDHLSEANETTD